MVKNSKMNERLGKLEAKKPMQAKKKSTCSITVPALEHETDQEAIERRLGIQEAKGCIVALARREGRDIKLTYLEDNRNLGSILVPHPDTPNGTSILLNQMYDDGSPRLTDLDAKMYWHLFDRDMKQIENLC